MAYLLHPLRVRSSLRFLRSSNTFSNSASLFDDRSPKTLSCFVFYFFSESPYGAQRRSLLGSYYLDSMSGFFDCRFNIHVKILRLTAALNPAEELGVTFRQPKGKLSFFPV
jgi:hypothetical protein